MNNINFSQEMMVKRIHKEGKKAFDMFDKDGDGFISGHISSHPFILTFLINLFKYFFACLL